LINNSIEFITSNHFLLQSNTDVGPVRNLELSRNSSHKVYHCHSLFSKNLFKNQFHR